MLQNQNVWTELRVDVREPECIHIDSIEREMLQNQNVWTELRVDVTEPECVFYRVADVLLLTVLTVFM